MTQEPAGLPQHAYRDVALRAVRDAVLAKDQEGKIQFVNPAAETLYGYPAGELLGRRGDRLVPADRSHEMSEILGRLHEGSDLEEIATIRCAKDGSAVPVYLSVAAVRDASGGLVGTMEVARSSDAASPDTSHSYLAAIVTSSDDAIISKDLNGVIQSFNAAAERMFGYTSAEAVGQSITMLIPKERLAEEVEILSRLRRGERIEHFETVRKTKDGRVLDISLTVSPVRNAFGRVVGASKIARDITEMKRTAKALAMQQEWFRVTLNSIGDAVIATDESARVIFLNGTAERMTGWDSEEAVGKPLADVFHIQNEKTGMRAANPAEQVLATHRVVGLENHTVLVGRDGTRRPIDDSAAPILDSSGEVLGVVLVFRDVTERRRLESERQTAVQERERLLESERAARADAERANRVKDDFLAMVSHELRTPLNAILGWTDLLRHSQPDEATLRHGLEVVARNTRIQSQLISDLLDISRIVTGKLRLEVQRVDPVGAVEASVESVLHAAEQKGVEIRTEIEPSVGAVMGDPARLQQIVWNLLTNAIKFTPQGGHVLVRLASVGSGVEITVRDTGMGIRRELFQDLFERFRHTGATTRNYGGLGLGLSIVKHLVELHGGNVRASSPGEGQGATFTIELPLAGDGRSLRPLPTEKQDGEALSHRISLAGVAVLVVEDEADTRDLIRRVLESHEAEVFLAATAAEAMEVLTAARPHILISDIGLPETDGYELMRRVRMSGTPQASLPAIALTAFARSEDRMRALRAGYQTHVAKPVEPAELVATVASLMEMIVPDRPS